MHGFVFYPDGGARDQREYNGGGIHGYKWELAAGARSIGHATHTTTPLGYCVKADSKEWMAKVLKGEVKQDIDWTRDTVKNHMSNKVAVTSFYDCAAPFAFGGTNNTAELKATIVILRFALNELNLSEATSLVIRQDAMYVVEGINDRIEKWHANGFRKRDGSEMPNEQLWRELYDLLVLVRASGVFFKIEWVEAHSKCIGNNSADQLATVALFKARELKIYGDLPTHPVKVTIDPNYWTGGLELRHHLMFMPYCFMRAGDAAEEVTDYAMSTQGKNVALNGKRSSDDGFGLLRTKKIDLIETVRQKNNTTIRELDYFYQIDINSVYGQAFRYLNLYGTEILHRKSENSRHMFVGDSPVSEELHPPFLAGVIYDNALMLSDLLDNYKDPNALTLQLTDITDTLFDYVEKDVKVKKGEEPRKETVCTLKPSIVVGYSKHKVKVGYKEKGEVKECEIILRAGVDFPDRNCLKRCEESNPRVYVLTNFLGGAFMFATVLESGGDLAIWSGVNASLRVV